MRVLLPILTGICAALLPPDALAQVSTGIDAVGADLQAGSGNIGDVILEAAEGFRPLINIAGALAITITGFFLTLTASENTYGMVKRVLMASLTAIVLVNIAASIASSFTNVTSDPAGAAATIGTEVLGVVTVLEFPAGVLCIVAIIFSGLKAITSYGTDDGTTQLRRTVIFVIAGFILIYTRSILGLSIAAGDATGPVNVIIDTADRIVQFMAIVALAMIVVAGLMMVVNNGKDEQYSRAKGLIIRVGIGVVIMLTSYALVRIIVESVI